ncbi:MAG TPA: SBBP repeat-containing protein [Bdellovibrionota bacterium]|jgi:hypothetical protein
MRNLLFVLLLLPFFSPSAFAAVTTFARPLDKATFDPRRLEEESRFAGTGDDYAMSSYFDASNNIYIAGGTYGSFSGYTNAGSYDCFFAKYDTNGNQQWVIQFGTSAYDFCMGIVLDASGNIYLVGYTSGAFSGFTNAGLFDIFLAKYTSAGVRTWLKQFGTNRDDIPLAIDVDGSNRPVFAGFTSGTFSGETSAGGEDAFLARYTTAGASSYMTQYGTTGNDRAISFRLDNSNRSFVAGTTTGAFSGFTNKGGIDGFTARFSNAGALGWAKQFGTSGDDFATGIGVDLGSGISQTVGVTTGAFTGFSNLGGEDSFITQYNAAGTYRWLTQFGTSDDDEVGEAFTDSNGDTIFGGLTWAAFSGYTNQGNADAFLVKYLDTGVLSWVRQIGTSGDDYFTGISGNASNITFSVGQTDAAFPGGTNQNGFDAIVARYTSAGSQSWLKQFGTN